MGTHARPGTQLCALVGAHRYIHDAHPGAFDEAPQHGSLPPELAKPLAAVLGRHTTTPIAAGSRSGTDGGGTDIASAPEFELPAREYRLFKGPIGAATESVYEGFWQHQSGSLWRPDDRAWCVATEIDLNTTYVGCDEPCRDAILATSEIRGACNRSGPESPVLAIY